jgi:two-component system NtrC family sensor kinase
VTVLRTSIRGTTGDDCSPDLVVRSALNGQARQGFLLLPPERLEAESDGLSQKAYLVLRPTPHAKATPAREERWGMVLVAGGPVRDDSGILLGTVYGGVLLNRNFPLVDKIRSIVFGDETYDGQMVGTVTIFQRDARIATNVTDALGLRAIGTRVSAQVYDKTIENGLPWHGRAFVVRDWYITAYEPLKDIHNEIIGMLYVGALEKKYDDMKTKLFLVFNAFTLLWILIVLALSTQLSRKFISPIRGLAEAARQVSSGSLETRLPETRSLDEIGVLTRSFNKMVDDIRDREQALREANRCLSATNKNYMEMLSFVSHELKNQIAGSAIAVRSIQRDVAGRLEESEIRLLDRLSDTLSYLGEMLTNYLDLARLESGEFAPARKELNFLTDVVISTLERLTILADRKSLLVKNHTDSRAQLVSDPVLLNIVYYNLLHNAIKHTPAGGVVILATHSHPGSFEFEVTNQGEGIPEPDLSRVFEKFYRRDRGGEAHTAGAGLGLFITQNLVELLGGAISVESEPNKWTRFRVSLPTA